MLYKDESHHHANYVNGKVAEPGPALGRQFLRLSHALSRSLNSPAKTVLPSAEAQKRGWRRRTRKLQKEVVVYSKDFSLIRGKGKCRRGSEEELAFLPNMESCSFLLTV